MKKVRSIIKHKQFGLLIGLVLIGLCLVFDLSLQLGVAGGITYIIPVMVALLLQDKHLVVVFGVLGVVLTIVGYFLSPDGVVLSIAILNRGLAIVAISIVTTTSYCLLQQHRNFNNTLIKIANTDELTRVDTRRAILEKLEFRITDAHRYKIPLSLLLIDVDDFKIINDTYGHPQGDHVLRQLGKILHSNMRETDSIGRYGGEEFICVLSYTEAEEARLFAERIRIIVEKSHPINGDEIITRPMQRPITISIGIASLSNQNNDIERLIKSADEALYKAKDAGKNCVFLTSSPETSAECLTEYSI